MHTYLSTVNFTADNVHIQINTAVRQNRHVNRSFSTDLINITAHSVDQMWCRCVGVKRVCSSKVNCHVQDIVGHSLKH